MVEHPVLVFRSKNDGLHWPRGELLHDPLKLLRQAACARGIRDDETCHAGKQVDCLVRITRAGDSEVEDYRHVVEGFEFLPDRVENHFLLETEVTSYDFTTPGFKVKPVGCPLSGVSATVRRSEENKDGCDDIMSATERI